MVEKLEIAPPWCIARPLQRQTLLDIISMLANDNAGLPCDDLVKRQKPLSTHPSAAVRSPTADRKNLEAQPRPLDLALRSRYRRVLMFD